MYLCLVLILNVCLTYGQMPVQAQAGQLTQTIYQFIKSSQLTSQVCDRSRDYYLSYLSYLSGLAINNVIKYFVISLANYWTEQLSKVMTHRWWMRCRLPTMAVNSRAPCTQYSYQLTISLATYQPTWTSWETMLTI